jgi:hypothetical protein
MAFAADGSFWTSDGLSEDLNLVRGNEFIPIPEDFRAVFMRTRTLDEITKAVQ